MRLAVDLGVPQLLIQRGSLPAYSAKARRMMSKTSGASSAGARRTLVADTVGEDLFEQPIGNDEGTPPGFNLLALAPCLQRHNRPGSSSRQPQQRLHPSCVVFTISTNKRCRTGVHGAAVLLLRGRRGHYTNRPARRQDQTAAEGLALFAMINYQNRPSTVCSDSET